MRLLTLLLLLLPLGVRATDAPAPEPLDPAIENALVELLQNNQIEPFVQSTTPKMADWEAEAKRLNIKFEGPALAKATEYGVNKSEQIRPPTLQLLSRGKERGFISSNAQWKVIKSAAVKISTLRFPGFHSTNQSLPHSDFNVTLQRHDPTDADSKFNGEYIVQLNYGTKFPTGWRFLNGPSWFQFPAGLLPDYLQDELSIINKMVGKHTLNTNADPALYSFGQTALDFVRTRQLSVYANELMNNVSLMLDDARLRNPNAKLPPLDELLKAFQPLYKQMVASADQVLALAEEIGADFSKATLVDVAGENYYAAAQGGNPPKIEVQYLDVTLRLADEDLSSNKKHLAGNYVISAQNPARLLGGWRVDQIRWAKLPEKAVTPEKQKKLDFENYVAERRALPPGTEAPELTLTSLTNKTLTKLSDLKGKLIILDWWASWCGPCQQPMTKLQSLLNDHPEWKDKVQIITVSIDDDLETAQAHALKRGWTNTANFWAGKSWFSENAQAYRVSSIPQCYLIITNGIIRASGLRPENIPSLVNRELNRK